MLLEQSVKVNVWLAQCLRLAFAIVANIAQAVIALVSCCLRLCIDRAIRIASRPLAFA